MTVGQHISRHAISGRLNEIAPYPEMGTPDQARAVAAYLAVSVQRRWTYTLDILTAGDMDGDMDGDTYWMTVQAMLAEFAALHLLMRLRETNPELAEEVAVQIREAWDDGAGVGEWVWTHAETLGIDLNEVGCLETAFRAAPTKHPPRAHRP